MARKEYDYIFFSTDNASSIDIEQSGAESN
jgi:hypothetical protein